MIDCKVITSDLFFTPTILYGYKDEQINCGNIPEKTEIITTDLIKIQGYDTFNNLGLNFILWLHHKIFNIMGTTHYDVFPLFVCKEALRSRNYSWRNEAPPLIQFDKDPEKFKLTNLYPGIYTVIDYPYNNLLLFPSLYGINNLRGYIRFNGVHVELLITYEPIEEESLPTAIEYYNHLWKDYVDDAIYTPKKFQEVSGLQVRRRQGEKILQSVIIDTEKEKIVKCSSLLGASIYDFYLGSSNIESLIEYMGKNIFDSVRLL